MEPSGAERLGASAVGRWSRQKLVARAGWRRQPAAPGGGLQEPNTATLGGGYREKIRRDVLSRQGLCHAAQSMLARTNSLCLRQLRHAIAAAEREHHDPLSLRSSIPSGAHERGPSRPCEAQL